MSDEGLMKGLMNRVVIPIQRVIIPIQRVIIPIQRVIIPIQRVIISIHERSEERGHVLYWST
jgi:hypothetical protein